MSKRWKRRRLIHILNWAIYQPLSVFIFTPFFIQRVGGFVWESHVNVRLMYKNKLLKEYRRIFLYFNEKTGNYRAYVSINILCLYIARMTASFCGYVIFYVTWCLINTLIYFFFTFCASKASIYCVNVVEIVLLAKSCLKTT